jgi:hypothetical protein
MRPLDTENILIEKKKYLEFSSENKIIKEI